MMQGFDNFQRLEYKIVQLIMQLIVPSFISVCNMSVDQSPLNLLVKVVSILGKSYITALVMWREGLKGFLLQK